MNEMILSGMSLPTVTASGTTVEEVFEADNEELGEASIANMEIVYDEHEDNEGLTKEHTWIKWKVNLLVKVKACAKLNKARLGELLNTLLTIDKTLWENEDKGLLLEAEEFFSLIFKITYYDDPDYSICNMGFAEHFNALSHA